MNDNLKLFSSIASKAFFGWIKVFVIGITLSVAGIITAFIIRGSSSVQELNTATDGKLLASAGSASGNLWSNTLLLVSIGFIVVYIMLANKYAVQTSILHIWENKLSGFVDPLVEKSFNHISSKQPDWLKSGVSAVTVKARLLDEIRKDKEVNHIQRRVLDYGFKKLKLEDIDFQDSENSVKSLITEKIKMKISDMANPSLSLLWKVSFLHLVIIGLAVYLDK